MAVTVYSLKNTNNDSSGTLLDHQNTSGGVERVIINYIRMKSVNPSPILTFHFGPSDALIEVDIQYVSAFGKNVAYATQMYQSLSHNDHNWQGTQGTTAGETHNAPTELMIADQEYFKITWEGNNNSPLVKACNIVIIPESG